MEGYTPAKLAFNVIEPENCDKELAPVIFLHGVTASKEYWFDVPQIVAKATKRKVYAIDARNHGDSEWTETFDFNCNSCDLLHFMDSHDIPKAILVGHSMGGMTGIKTALQQPERVEKLIVEDMTVRRVTEEMLNAVKFLITLAHAAVKQIPPDVDDENAARHMIGEYIKSHLPEAMKESTRITSDNRFMLRRTADGHYAFKANIDVILKAMRYSDDFISENKGVYEGPAYFIYGKISPFLVGHDEANIKQNFPKAELIGIENATHTVHTDCPEEFNKALLKCLS